MTTVLMIRHGESAANKDDIFAGCRTDAALQERGLLQAKLTADFVASNYKIDQVYTSGLQRAYITGQCIADRLGIAVKVVEQLREIDGGLWEGMKFDDMPVQFPEEYDLWLHDYGNSCCPGGETVAQCGQRIMGAVTRIAEENPDKTVLVATHASPVRIMQGLVQTGGFDGIKDIPWPSNASVTVFTFEHGKWHSVAFSLDEHLGELRTALPKNV